MKTGPRFGEGGPTSQGKKQKFSTSDETAGGVKISKGRLRVHRAPGSRDWKRTDVIGERLDDGDAVVRGIVDVTNGVEDALVPVYELELPADDEAADLLAGEQRRRARAARDVLVDVDLGDQTSRPAGETGCELKGQVALCACERGGGGGREGDRQTDRQTDR